MESNYNRLGDFIIETGPKNSENEIELLKGISNNKHFQKAKTNTVGIDLSTYRIVRTNEFAFNRATTRNGEKISIALRKGKDCVVSPSYRIFKIKDESILNSQYLEMWFKRPAFDRYARFRSHGSAHEFFDYDEMCEVQLPIPSIEKQREIVNDYHTVQERIRINEELNIALEETAQTLYKHWFVDFEFPDENGNPYKSSGGVMEYNEELDMEIPVGWVNTTVKNFCYDMKSGGTPSRSNNEFWNKSDYPWFKTGELKNSILIDSEEFISEEALKKTSAKLLPINSVLIAMYGQGNTKGQIGYLKIEASTNQACCAMICEDEKESTYLYNHLRYNRDLIVSEAIGGAQPNLSKEIIENIKILQPNKELLEGHLFVEIMNSKEINTKEIKDYKVLAELLLSKMATVVDGKELVN